MSTINYTYNVIVDRFRQFAAGHFQLRRFTHGEISQADLEKEAEWPWLHVKPRAINYAPGTRSFSFEIFISDLPRDKEDKTGYQAESITDCSLIFQDLINEIYLGNMFGSDVVLTRPVNAEPFVEQYTHTLTGVTGTIELNLDYDWSACSIPASWNYNTPTDSPSDGWGALQFIESLDQNGVFVSLLNDVEAPGNSYYYGTNASGVKGWYAIVDNVGLTCETLPDCATIISIVDDIAALESGKVDKVAGKGLSTEDYTTAEKSKLAGIEAGAEVNVNADWNAVSGDAQILNKPTIPAAQVNSDWNATSGVAEILNKPTIPSIAGLVPETRTLTINGTTQDLSANRTFTIATGLTVGTTPITSGTVGRVLFEGTGNVLQQSSNFFWDNTNSRLGIGTASPSFGLDVNGTARVRGASNIGTTTAFTIANSDSVNLLQVQDNGYIRIGSQGTSAFRVYSTDASGDAEPSGLHLVLNSRVVSSATPAGIGMVMINGINGTATTGTQNVFLISKGFAPTSGTATYAASLIIPTINQTGGANGITRGLYINPTLTAAADFRAIENSVGKVCLNTTSGNTLIGTTTDAGYKLDVNGTARIQNALTATANINVDSGASNSAILFKTAGTSKGVIGTDNSIFGVNNSIIGLYVYGANDFELSTNNVRRLIAKGNGNILIGTTTDVASAILQVSSTTKGFLPPRMTNAQRLAIASPAVGLIVYCTDAVEGLYVNKSTGWTFVI